MRNRLFISSVFFSSCFVITLFSVSSSFAATSDKAMTEFLLSLYDRDAKSLPKYPDYQQCVAYKLKDEASPPAFVQLPMSPVSSQEAEALFREFKNNKNIPFRYAADGCYARADQMIHIAESKGIKMAKVFIEGDLMAKTPKAIMATAEWQYHVAPLLSVIHDGENKLMVMDPSLFDHPVSEKQWRKTMTHQNPKQTYCVFYTSRFTVAPNEPEQISYMPRDQKSVEAELGQVHALLEQYDIQQINVKPTSTQKGVDHE